MAKWASLLCPTAALLEDDKTADVMVVQTCLAGIKVKMKPLYKSKVDGKAGKNLINAICTFQENEKIKPTGKIMPGDQTVSKLKMRTPSSVKPTALPMGGAAKPGNTSKAKEMARKAANTINDNTTLPPEDKSSLIKAIQAAGDEGIPVSLKEVRITNGGRFEVELAIDKAALPSGHDQSLTKSLAEKVSAHIAKSTRWSSGQAGTLIYKTTFAYEGLERKSKPSQGMLQSLEINTTGLNEAAKSIMGSLEKLSGVSFDK